MSDRFLRTNETLEIAGISKSSMYALLRAGDFPQPRRCGPRTIRWRHSEILEWIENRPNWNGAEAA